MTPVFFTGRFRRDLRRCPDPVLAEVEKALSLLKEQLGDPHRHTGLGIRKLRRNYFELRVGRDLRLVFTLADDGATFVLAGDHDDVRRFLNSL